MSRLEFNLPLPPSVNHAYIHMRNGGKRWSETALAWMGCAGMLAKAAARDQKWAMTVGKKLVMELYFYWPDNRRRDTHNTHKILADALQGIIYDDDRWLLMRDMDFTVDKKKDRLEVRVYEFDRQTNSHLRAGRKHRGTGLQGNNHHHCY